MKLTEILDNFLNETIINYNADDLDYQVAVEFSDKKLTDEQKKNAEKIGWYWAKIPYVSEGASSINWKDNTMIIDVDLTKSRSDDVGNRSILEKLAKWMEEGTPIRKDGTRNIEGVKKPVSVKTDNV